VLSLTLILINFFLNLLFEPSLTLKKVRGREERERERERECVCVCVIYLSSDK